MKEQIGILRDEKQATLDEIAKNRKELSDLYAQLNAKKKILDKKDDEIAHLEALIDEKFN